MRLSIPAKPLFEVPLSVVSLAVVFVFAANAEKFSLLVRNTFYIYGHSRFSSVGWPLVQRQCSGNFHSWLNTVWWLSRVVSVAVVSEYDLLWLSFGWLCGFIWLQMDLN